MRTSKPRARITLSIRITKHRLKRTFAIYLLKKIKQKVLLSEISERRNSRSKTKKFTHSTSKLKEAFSFYDKDGDGKVNPSDLGVIIRSLGGNPTEAQVNDILLKENLKNPIDFHRFVGLMRKHLRIKPQDREIRRAFKVIDDDNDGYIEVSNLRHILTTMGERLDSEEFDEWIRGVGFLRDGKVRYEDIIAPTVVV